MALDASRQLRLIDDAQRAVQAEQRPSLRPVRWPLAIFWLGIPGPLSLAITGPTDSARSIGAFVFFVAILAFYAGLFGNAPRFRRLGIAVRMRHCRRSGISDLASRQYPVYAGAGGFGASLGVHQWVIAEIGGIVALGVSAAMFWRWRSSLDQPPKPTAPGRAPVRQAPELDAELALQIAAALTMVSAMNADALARVLAAPREAVDQELSYLQTVGFVRALPLVPRWPKDFFTLAVAGRLAFRGHLVALEQAGGHDHVSFGG